MERENFEDKLKNAFDQAEIAPSDHVWRNVELDLAKADGDAMKRRLAFFKLLAAASVIFALLVGGMSLYYVNGSMPLNATARLELPSSATQSPSPTALPENNNTSDQQSLTSGVSTTPDNGAQDAAEDQREGVFSPDLSKRIAADIQPKSLVDNRSVKTLSESREDAYASLDHVKPLGEKVLDPMRMSKSIMLVINTPEMQADPVAMMMARLAQREAELRKTEKKKDKKNLAEENLWASAGFSAGSFNHVSPGTPSSAAAPATLAAATNADQEAQASGSSYSMGMNVGKKLAQRWVLQGGLNYLMQSSDYTAQTAISSSDFTSFRPASTNELEKLNLADGNNTAKVVPTAPYNVNNQVRYLSLPVQAGYLIVDKKVGVQLNAGLSTDLFLHNSKTAEASDLQQINQSLTDDSPYRTMNFSGLVGTELSYRFAERYRVSLNPGLRYPINSVYKSDLGIQSNPLTFDLGLRFRYIFR